jgi:hypothetical protein
LSPELFSVYINDLIKLLKQEGVGCYMLLVFIACILFADDLALLAPSRHAMQRMLDICVKYCDKYCLKFNAKKTKSMVFGPLHSCASSISPLRIRDNVIEFVETWRYLGFYVKAGKVFSFCAKSDLRKFYMASNSILNVLHKPNEVVLMKLLYTNCVTILTYGCSVKEYNSREMTDCNTAINDAIRKIFTYNRWESVRELRKSMFYDSIYEIFVRAERNFLSSLVITDNPVLKHIAIVFNLV